MTRRTARARSLHGFPSLPALALAACFLASIGIVLPAVEPEWPRFRGPNGQGQVDADMGRISWGPGDALWKVALAGTGYSSPVVGGSDVYVTSTRENDAALIVECLDTAHGGRRWQKSFPLLPHEKHKFNSYAASTPALDAARLYVAMADPKAYRVVALDRKDGRELWRHDMGPFASENGFGVSPIVVDGKLIVANDQDGSSSIVALDGATGRLVWTAERKTQKTAYSTPCLFRTEQGQWQLITSSWAHGLSALCPETGKMLWELPVFKLRTVGSPAVADGVIFASTGVGGVGKQMIAVRPETIDGKTSAKILYEVPAALIPYVPSPVAHGDLIFLWHDRGVVACLEAATGKVVWRERIGGGEYFSSPIRIADRLYGVSREGEVVVLSAGRAYQLLARIPLGERTHATPAVAGGVLFFRTLSHLTAVGPAGSR
jgi:outer membrane protein assembly factor BamB